MSEEASLARPYVHLLDGRDPAEVLRSTPARLNRILGAMTPDQIEHKPGPKRWSVREILCHLADCEIAWAWRLRLTYGAARPTLEPFDQDPWAAAYDGAAYTTEAARATWNAVRRWNVALLEGLTEEQKQRPAHHPEIGDVTLWSLVEIAAGHDLHHLVALERLSGSAAPA